MRQPTPTLQPVHTQHRLGIQRIKSARSAHILAKRLDSRFRGNERIIGFWVLGFGFMLVEASITTNNFSLYRNLILGFASALMMQSMYLDLNEIEKLTPRGLLNLRPMLFVVEVITGLITKQAAGSRMMLKLVRALARFQKQVRDNEAYNLNVKIKAWVMAQAERRAWVRGIIGVAAIRRWQVRYDNLADPLPSQPVRRPAPRSAPLQDCLPYTWKRFAMADLSWLETRHFPARETSMPTSPGSWQQPRQRRGFKPVEFYPFELAADYEPLEPRADTKEPTNTKPDPPPKQAIGAGGIYEDPDDDKPP